MGSPQAANYRAIVTAGVMAATLMQTLDTTIVNVALPYIQGIVRSVAGPDHLGAHLLYRRGRDHDAADRLARRRVSAPSGCFSFRWPASPSPRCSAALAQIADRDRALSCCCKAFSARRWCRCRKAPCSTSIRPSSAARPWHLGYRRHGRADPRADARRLADRFLQLALGLLHQLPIGILAIAGSVAFHRRTPNARRDGIRLCRLLRARHRRSAHCSSCSTAASSRTGSVDGNYRLGRRCAVSDSICSSFICSPPKRP